MPILISVVSHFHPFGCNVATSGSCYQLICVEYFPVNLHSKEILFLFICIKISEHVHMYKLLIANFTCTEAVQLSR